MAEIRIVLPEGEGEDIVVGATKHPDATFMTRGIRAMLAKALAQGIVLPGAQSAA